MEKIVSKTLNLILFCKSDTHTYTIDRKLHAFVKTHLTLGQNSTNFFNTLKTRSK